MTIHTCRDLIVGSTGSYGNFYALGCFMVGVLGFTQVGASGHAAFVSSLLPTPITSGSFSGSALFGSGGTGILEIPLAGLPVISGTYYLPALYTYPTYNGEPNMWSGSVGGGLGPQTPFNTPGPIPPCILAIKSANYPLANSGLFTITALAYSPGYSDATGTVTGTYNIYFNYRSNDNVPVETGSIQWTLFPPVEWVLNDVDVPWNNDPDADGDVDVPGPDNNPSQTPHVYSGSPTIQSQPGVDSPRIGDTGPPNYYPVYSFSDDTAAPPGDLDYDGSCYDKAWLYDIRAGFLDGQNPSVPGTVVCNVVDQGSGGVYDYTLGTNGDGKYHAINMLRAIFQSPHPSGWQVRLCLENAYTRASAARGCCFSVAPGTNAPTGSGDFKTGDQGGLHLHAPLWHNTNSGTFGGTVVGLDPNFSYGYGIPAGNHGNQNQPSLFGNTTLDYAWRFFAWGDDQTGTVFFLNRNMTGAADGMCLFGIPEDETQPLPPLTVQRLFVIGSCNNNGNDIHWHCGNYLHDGTAGMAYSMAPYLGPISCVMANYTLLNANSNLNYINADAAAGPTPFLGANELIPVDLIAGAQDNNYADGNEPVLPMEPRRLGRVPFARQGPATNMTNWTTGSAGSWLHAKNGVYLPWGGLSVLP